MIEIDMSGKRALVMGVTNARSLGWAIADKLHAAGATMAFSYQGERLRGEMDKLTADMPDALSYQVDVTREEELKAMVSDLGERWGSIDCIVHAIAFAPRTALDGRYVETTRDDWLLALQVSAYSLVAIARETESLLGEGGSIVTLSYYAAEKVVPKYNVMGVAKSALESSVRYLAHDLGPKGVRVNAISAGPVRTVAARSIPGFVKMYKKVGGLSPLGRNVEQEDVGNLGLFLLSPLASCITGETVYVDAGYHIMGVTIEE